MLLFINIHNIFIYISIIPLQPPRHVMNIYGYQHSTVEKYHRFFFLFSPFCRRAKGPHKFALSICTRGHAGRLFIRYTVTHARSGAHIYRYRHIHTPVMDFLETSSPKKDDEEVEEVYREKRLFRYFFPGFRPT